MYIYIYICIYIYIYDIHSSWFFSSLFHFTILATRFLALSGTHLCEHTFAPRAAHRACGAWWDLSSRRISRCAEPAMRRTRIREGVRKRTRDGVRNSLACVALNNTSFQKLQTNNPKITKYELCNLYILQNKTLFFFFSFFDFYIFFKNSKVFWHCWSIVYNKLLF